VSENTQKTVAPPPKYRINTVADLPILGVRIIGFGHKARQGKDSAAQFVQREVLHGKGAILSFAESLKEYCRRHHNMTEKDAPLLQRVGAELRAEDPDVFIKALCGKLIPDGELRIALIKSIKNEVMQNLVYTSEPVAASHILIPDVRFHNEADFVRRQGGGIYKIVRMYQSGLPYVDGSRDPKHQSEVDLDDYQFNHIFRNYDGLIDQFYDSLFSFFEGRV
jgi:hypothetical protein